MQLHDLQPNNKNKTKKRVGRGGNRGKTSGKGHKGQLARAGGTPRPQIRDRLKKIPKLRGYKHNPVKTAPVAINLGVIAQVVESGDHVTPRFLKRSGLLRKEGGKIPAVKILATGDIDTDVTVVDCEISESAQEKVEAAGGTVKTRNN